MKSKRPDGDEALNPKEISDLSTQVPEWHRYEVEGVPRLERSYKFKNFSQALAFSVQIGILAEKEDHHPTLTTEWGRVTVTFWTHAIQGLHHNDFICAAKADQIYS
jgi:4a-hydroxytetrahydrobiopterin dehydratase